MSLSTYWSGKGVLITGGTAGLGLALAQKLMTLGARVAVVGRDPVRVATVQALGIHAITADVANKDAIHKIAGESAGVLGKIDVLINNASYLGATPLRLLLDTDCEDLEQALQTNVLGPFRLTKAVLPGMLLRGEGLIVNISSDAAVNAYERWGAYSASKAATDHLSRTFDAELRAQGVRTVALDPGDMATAMHFAAIPDADPKGLADPKGVAGKLAVFLPLVRDLKDVRFTASGWRSYVGA